jgi:hypothetical protein
VPLDSFAEEEGDGLAAARDLPLLREVADEPDVLVVLHQAIEDLVVDRAGSRVVRDDRVQPPRIADGALDKGVRIPLDLLTAGGKEKKQDKNGQPQRA